MTLYGYREGGQDEYYFETSVRTTRLGDFEFHDYQPWDTLAVSLAGYETMVITLAELDINKLQFIFFIYVICAMFFEKRKKIICAICENKF